MTRSRAVFSGMVIPLQVICVVVGMVRAGQTPMKFWDFDQPFYLGIAYDLDHSGRFTDGYRFAEPGPDGSRPSGMRFAPLYPAFLAAVSRIDGRLRAGMDCLVASRGADLACSSAAPVARGVQLLEVTGILWMIWWMGCALSGSAAMGWVSLGLALFTTPLLVRSADALMTETLCLSLTTLASVCGVAMVRGAGGGVFLWALATGAALGSASLTRPAFLYLVIVYALCLGGVAAWRWRAAAGWARLAGFALGAAGMIAPWIVRNAVVMGRPALTFGYDSHTLVQRIAFDTMSWREYGQAYLCWLPNGTSLGRRLIGPGGCDRFLWDDKPDSFYTLGLRHMLDETLAASGGYEHHLSYLVHTYILRMPVTHALVTVPLALRGAYVSHWWGFALLVPALAWTVWALRGLHGTFLVLALPAWFMLTFNALVAVNQARYNLMLVPVFAVAGALTLRGAGTRLVGAWPKRKGIGGYG